ncbi:MAG: TonB-dependent receptor plug domain-containing protein [Bacteroidia bacterium]
MLKRIALLLPLIGLIQALHAQKFTISGYVTDSQSGEKLISARVLDPTRKEGALSNAYGFYSLTLDAGTVALNCSYIGFKSFSTVFELTKDTTLNIDLIAEGVEVETVEITDERDIVESSQMSTIDVPVEMIKKIPSLMGEVDVIKALQLLPGVQKGSEGSTGFYVRGGGPDQNLILLDGVPVYNVSHLFGFFSVFPADAISNVSLIKGGFPARYGGRLSSVLDISLKDGNMKNGMARAAWASSPPSSLSRGRFGRTRPP